MRITSIGHAAILIETNGTRILSDPWWAGPCFGTQWWLYPKAYLDPIEKADPDFIYISHAHVDHLHNGTLSRLPKTAKCLVSSAIDIEALLARLGFEVVTFEPGIARDIGNGISVEITPTCSGDTLMVVTDGRETCVNLNDALHPAPQDVHDRICAELTSRYATMDYVYCGYGIASHFPVCYVVPGQDRVGNAIKRQKFFNRRWCTIVADLKPRFAFPFAADVALLEDELFWANEPIHNTERPTDVFRAQYPNAPTTVYDAAPGFCIEDGKVVREVLFGPVVADELREAYRDDLATANRSTKPDNAAVEDLAELFRRNVEICRPYLLEYSGGYRFLVKPNDADIAITIAKSGSDITVRSMPVAELSSAGYDVEFRARYSYLRRALTQPYGDEVLFVGSGCIIEYRDRERAMENLHGELIVLMSIRDSAPRSRFGDQPRFLYMIKSWVKTLIGRADTDIYDLRHWIGGEAVSGGSGAS